VSFVLLTTAPAFAGKIIYVDDDASGANDGSSWTNAYNYLQDALADANTSAKPVEIHVAQGTYKPDLGAGITPGDREATFQLINDVTLKGGYAGNGEPDHKAPDIKVYETVLSGDLNDNDVDVNDPRDLLEDLCRAENSYHVITGSGTDSTAILEGFTITSGNASVSNYNYRGGGMFNEDGSPTVANCRFIENSAEGWGGGMLNIFDSYPALTNCEFVSNYAGTGGGMLNFDSDPTLVNCIFVGNSAGRSGGIGNGGGIHNDSGSPTLTNCVFSGNSANYVGGGIYNEADSAPVLTNCTFTGNSGVAIFIEGSTTVTNCIFWGNTDKNGMGESAQFRFYADYSTININYSCVQGWTGSLGGIGNIGADPLFWDTDGADDMMGTEDDNLRLLPGSPCIDTGDPNYVTGPNETDLDDNARVIRGRIDMGAFEYQPRTIYVDDDAAGANDGSSWDNAYKYLQDALSTAYSGDEIRVAEGNYKPDLGTGITPGDRQATFQLINGVTIKGGYAGIGATDPNARDIQLYKTALSGDLNGDDAVGFDEYNWRVFLNKDENSYNVVTGSRTDRTAVIEGFTIMGGNAYEYGIRDAGGGMYIYRGNPTVVNCTFTRNWAYDGGGIYYFHYFNPAITITNCVFSGNKASEGGGVTLWGDAVLTNCTFIDNWAGNGGGMRCNSSTLTNCIFSGNSASSYGGGMHSSSGATKLTNCVLSANSAIYKGGGVYNWYGDLTLTNCTFCGNSAEYGGGILEDDDASGGNGVIITNSIFWANKDSSGEDEYGQGVGYDMVFIDYSCVQGWTGTLGGIGNIGTDPCLVELGYWQDPCNSPYHPWGIWVEGEYHLLPDSPCIDTGDPNYIAEPNETDLDGNPRVLDGNNDGIFVIDMGAYEHRYTITAEARIIPQTINLASKGNWITAYIWLPDEYDVIDIEPDSIFLEDEIQPEQFSIDQQQQVATARFNREDVQAVLTVGDVEFKITGKLTDGTVFEATDTIKVINKAGK
jgi:hypothetical protein